MQTCKQKKSQKCHPTIYVVSLPFFFPQHTIKIIQNKQFFKPHKIYLNTSLTGILGFFSLDFSWLWITLQQAQCIFRTAFQNSCHMQIYILSVKKLHCAECLFLGNVQVFQSQVWLIIVALFLITPAVTDGGNSIEFHPSYASWEAAQ